MHVSAPPGGRRPLEIKYTYPSTLGHVVSEYIWLWGSISKTLGGVREQTDRQTDRSYNFIIVDFKFLEFYKYTHFQC